MDANIKSTLLENYKETFDKVNEVNDFGTLFKQFDGFNLSPDYATIGEDNKLLGGVGMRFDFMLPTKVGFMQLTLFCSDDNELELWESFEYHPTLGSGCLGLFTVYSDHTDMTFETDYCDGYVPSEK